MRIIDASDAKIRLLGLLEQVARGQSFLITKRGKPVAVLSPLATGKRQGPKEMITSFRKQFAKSLKPFSLAEIKALNEAGCRPV
jgi:prevent-host-death family protein